MKIVSIIPARYDSLRFPGKLMQQLGDKTVILRTYQNVLATGLFEEVVVATDSDLIFKEISDNGGQVQMTRKDHQCGSDRIAEAASRMDADLVVNVQGDEPFVSPSDIDSVIETLIRDGHDIVTLRTLATTDEVNDPNAVKIAMGESQRALYFSRAPIPFRHPSLKEDKADYWRHIGLYGYRRAALLRWSELERDPLENHEGLEQLRALSNGMSIQAIPANSPSRGIDTPDDLEWARQRVEKLGAQAFPN